MTHRRRALTDLGQQIDELTQITKEELRQRWTGTFRTALPPRVSREFLVRSLAYRLQEKTLGGLTPKARRALDQLARQREGSSRFAVALSPSYKPGTRLIRQWKGELHEVEVLEDGYTWQGQAYPNLSRIARAITGTRWSGPLFFGLKKRPRAADQKASHLAAT